MTIDESRATALREALVEEIAARPPWPGSGPWDERVLAAMRLVPRHRFVPGASLDDAYTDAPLSIGYGQTISQPTIVAAMSQALALTARSTVLEIGTGCGYQAAVLSCLAGHVVSVEIVPELARSAAARLQLLGFAVDVRAADGSVGVPELAPFDRIVLTAAPLRVPDALLGQLAVAGILVAPIGAEDTTQALVRYVRGPRGTTTQTLAAVRFVPLVDEVRR